MPTPDPRANPVSLPAIPKDSASNSAIGTPLAVARLRALAQNSPLFNCASSAALSFISTPELRNSSINTLPNSTEPEDAPIVIAPSIGLPVVSVTPVAAANPGSIIGKLSPTMLNTAPGLFHISFSASE